MSNVTEVVYPDISGPQHRVHVHLSAGNNACVRFDIPQDWKPGAHGWIATYEHDDGTGQASFPFRMCVKLTNSPDDYSGPYGFSEQMLRFQVAGGANTDVNLKQLTPGRSYWVTMTLAHDGKLGYAKAGTTFSVGVELSVPH